MIIRKDNENPFDDGLGAARGIINALEITFMTVGLPLGIVLFYVGGIG